MIASEPSPIYRPELDKLCDRAKGMLNASATTESMNEVANDHPTYAQGESHQGYGRRVEDGEMVVIITN